MFEIGKVLWLVVRGVGRSVDVVKVGRKYATVREPAERYPQEWEIEMRTGREKDRCGLTHANGWGAVVYESEPAYVEHCRVVSERERLRKRLSNGQYFNLSKEIDWNGVDELHELLDRLKVSSKF